MNDRFAMWDPPAAREETMRAARREQATGVLFEARGEPVEFQQSADERRYHHW